ncbi:hypothetical protein PsorP6_000102 [Peronosclerospora sorghi]|uniref:Uncharacterized protein n=1 Tax=Peronosclerospora sorghi TaxID=230839 RepID=A0ACC0WYE0_9STRA|nr:hypothetical protein PsorP6_000102 [Peronosclerospora sorghi]
MAWVAALTSLIMIKNVGMNRFKVDVFWLHKISVATANGDKKSHICCNLSHSASDIEYSLNLSCW